MSLDTEIHGYRVEHREEQNDWYCIDLKLSTSSLKAMRAKLGKRDADERRVADLPAIKLPGYTGASEQECLITLLADDGDQAWVKVTRATQNGERQDREKVSLDRLVLDTPQVREALAEAKRHQALAKVASDTAAYLLNKLPRVTRADLRGREASKEDAA